jgi:protein involved in polysaccharide export with SLBB domain
MGQAFAQAAVPAPAGTAIPADAAAQAQERLHIAATSDEYPVTPGDEYRLTYRQGDSLLAMTVIVETDNTISFGVFGKVDAAEMTFPRLKQSVEKLILSGYPRSNPSLTLSALSTFRVYVKGEISTASYVTAWGLSRLSDILQNVSAPSATLRDVEIVSADGTSRRIDLFKATRLGVREEDPFVKLGDTILLSRSVRRIQISGEVRLPGTYEMLAEEQLGELLDSYAGGALPSGDTTNLRIERVSQDKGSVLHINLAEDRANATVLEDGDIVSVPAKSSRQPVVFFEGAIVPPTAVQATQAGTQPAATPAGTAATPSEYSRVLHSFVEGETLSDALAAVRASLAPLADLASAYILRDGRAEPMYIDLRPLLASSKSPSDLPLVANDRIVIPLSKFNVFVSGAVGTPGTYPYTPDRTYQYYVNQAGGSAQEDPKSIIITDRGGAGRDTGAIIQSEDRIYVSPASISVQGAVFAPGIFPFRTGLPASAYIALAGGSDPERNGSGNFTVSDKMGKEKKAADPLAPGDRIYLPNNSFFYNLNRYAPVITLVATIVGTTITVLSYLLLQQQIQQQTQQ